MTGVLVPRAESVGRDQRRRALIVALAGLTWAVFQIGAGDLVNRRGWASFARFWTAVTEPALATEFVTLTIEAAGITLAFAVLGTALSVVIGGLGALTLSASITGGGILWRTARAVFAVLRSIHEVLWAILGIQVLGFDPLVAILAIGIPFGAVTAKVYAEIIDDADQRPYRNLRAQGAGRLAALAYGILPTVTPQLVSYGFYRLECSVRSAAVLGVLGIGGLGFQLDLSFESLRYGEIWVLIAALMLLSGVADAWSQLVRRADASGTGASADAASAHWSSRLLGRLALGGSVRTWSAAVFAMLVVGSWVAVDPDLGRLWSGRSGTLGRELAAEVLRPSVGPDGWGTLLSASADTLAMSILAIAMAVLGGLLIAPVAARPLAAGTAERPARRVLGAAARLGLLLLRAVPAPVWAFLFVLVLFPGPWPGAVALGVYNLGVLGRLFAEAVEDADLAATAALRRLGAGTVTAFLYGTIPVVAPRVVSLARYRWEVIVRESVVVGVVGAGGLGQLINEHLAARDFAAVSGAIGALVVLALVIDVRWNRLTWPIGRRATG